MSSKSVNEEVVYKCVGQPQPIIIKEIFHTLLDKQLREAYIGNVQLLTLITHACQTGTMIWKVIYCSIELSNVRLNHGLALADILEDLLNLVLTLDMPPEPSTILLDRMAIIESRLAVGCSEKIQSLALISAFIEAREAALKRHME